MGQQPSSNLHHPKNGRVKAAAYNRGVVNEPITWTTTLSVGGAGAVRRHRRAHAGRHRASRSVTRGARVVVCVVYVVIGCGVVDATRDQWRTRRYRRRVLSSIARTRRAT